MVNVGRGPKRGVGIRARGRGHGRPDSVRPQTVTPAPESMDEIPKFSLKLRFSAEDSGFVESPGRSSATRDENTGVEETKGNAQEHKHSLPVAQREVMTRTGRVIRKNQDPQFVWESDALRESSSATGVNKVDNEDHYQSEFCSSPRKHGPATPFNYAQHLLRSDSVPYVRTYQVEPLKRSRLLKNLPTPKVLRKVDEDTAFSTNTIIPPSSRFQSDRCHPELHSSEPPLPQLSFGISIDPKVFEIMEELKNSDFSIDLPTLSSGIDDDEQPYTAITLLHLYLLAYHHKKWNLCDLIADTWIRAFHAQRNHGARDPTHQLWRLNTALVKRQQLANDAKQQGVPGVYAEFHRNAPDYKLTIFDPLLAPDICDFDSSNLNELYHHTESDCGARELWADAMALCGDKTEQMLVDSAKGGFVWHKDLLFNVMASSLRMVRRKLTLKIEESTEGAWCKRYHEHGKHGLPCYRELAWKRKQELGDSDDEDADMAAAIEAEMMRGEKRELDDKHCEVRGAKRTRFEDDVDAEGDSAED